jgi:hypothetical protein
MPGASSPPPGRARSSAHRALGSPRCARASCATGISSSATTGSSSGGETSGGFEAEATYPGLRLLPDPIAELWEDAPVDAGPVSHDSAKRRLPAGACGAFPLRAIYVLDEPSPAEDSDRAETTLLPPREGSSPCSGPASSSTSTTP